MFALKTFYFRGQKTTLQKFTPHPGGGRGLTLTFQMGTSISYSRCGFSIETFYSYEAKLME